MVLGVQVSSFDIRYHPVVIEPNDTLGAWLPVRCVSPDFYQPLFHRLSPKDMMFSLASLVPIDLDYLS